MSPPYTGMKLLWITLIGLAWWICQECPVVMAGGESHNLLLVVNSDSSASKTLANHYAQLRQVPSRNVVFLEGIPDSETMSLEDFKQKILAPLFKTMETRGIGQQIEYIVYSSDFPTAVDVKADFELIKDKIPKEYHKIFRPRASITGLTFFAEWVRNKNPSYIGLKANGYMRQTFADAMRNVYTNNKNAAKYTEVLSALGAGKWNDAQSLAKELYETGAQNGMLAALIAVTYSRSDDSQLAKQWMEKARALGVSQTLAECDAAFQQQFGGTRQQELIPWHETVGFSAKKRWSQNGSLAKKGGTRYYLSTMLSVTRNRGISVEESIAHLKRAKSADFSKPIGTFYFQGNKGVRADTRKKFFEPTIKALKDLGHQGEISTKIVPTKKADILGCVIGTDKVFWDKSRSEILPGAICEHLTSLGGYMDLIRGKFDLQKQQTPATEHLRFGAAGSCGAVVEPYAIAEKFPHPFIHVHYVRGSSLGEAFYQSIFCPYQILVLGDPLCRPWAPDLNFQAALQNENISKGDPVRIQLQGSIRTRFKQIRTYVDGVEKPNEISGDRIEIQTKGLSSGQHQLRVAGVDASPIQHQGIGDLSFAIGEPLIDAHATESEKSWKIDLETKLTGKVVLIHLGRVVVSGTDQKQFEIRKEELGAGPVRIQPKINTNGQWIAGPILILNSKP